MKARLLSTAIRTGHAALDFIRLAQRNDHSSASAARPTAQSANAILESLDDQDRTLPPDLVVPVERLVTVLTESLQGMHLDNPEDRMDVAKLFRGCRVRLVGIPERHFIIRDIYWDYSEVRIKEIGSDTFYLVPWNCLEIIREQTK